MGLDSWPGSATSTTSPVARVYRRKRCEVHSGVRCAPKKEIGRGISHRESEELIAAAKALKEAVLQWIRANHEMLLLGECTTGLLTQ